MKQIFAFTVFLLVKVIRTLKISQNLVEILAKANFTEDLYIQQDVYYWLLENELTVIGGTLKNEGGLYITNSNNLTSSFSAIGPYVVNKGIIDHNTMDAEGVSVCNVSVLDTFQNSGEIYFGVSGGLFELVPFTVTAKLSWGNTGKMIFEKAAGLPAALLMGESLGSSNLLYIANEGAICMYNTDWSQTTNIVGSGCITVGRNSTLELRITHDKQTFFVAPNQVINLDSSESTLSFRGLTISYLSRFPLIVVAGFGNGNTIRLDRAFKGYSYKPETGILKIKYLGPYGLRLRIGTGYLPDKFTKARDGMGASLSYSETPPNEAPLSCQCDRSFPKTPQDP